MFLGYNWEELVPDSISDIFVIFSLEWCNNAVFGKKGKYLVILVLVVSYEVPFWKKTVLTFFYAIFDLPSVNVMRFLYKSIVYCKIGILGSIHSLKRKGQTKEFCFQWIFCHELGDGLYKTLLH